MDGKGGMRGMSPFSLGRQQGGRCQASVTPSPKEEERAREEPRSCLLRSPYRPPLRQRWRRMHDNAWEGRAAALETKRPHEGEVFVTF